MGKRDYLILTKGRAVCLALDSALGLLNEMELNVSSAESARQECVTELFYIITRVDSITWGREEWTGVYEFLVEIGISVPEDVHLEMSYVDSMLDVIPGEEICNWFQNYSYLCGIHR